MVMQKLNMESGLAMLIRETKKSITGASLRFPIVSKPQPENQRKSTDYDPSQSIELGPHI